MKRGKDFDGSVLSENSGRRIGSLADQKLIDAGYDIDECNDEIVEMFEGLVCESVEIGTECQNNL